MFRKYINLIMINIEKIRNSYLYLIFSLISIVVIIFFSYDKYPVSDIFINIFCSILAASILAAFIEEMNIKQKTIEKNKFKKIYFNAINDDFSRIMGQILWFEEHKDDDFIDWNQNIEYFLDYNFKINAIQRTEPYNISFEEATKRLEEISEKYKFDKIQIMSDDEKLKVSKMFNIISHDCINLFFKFMQIENNKIDLDVGNYIKLEDLEEVLNNMKRCCYIMSNKEKAYGVGIILLISSANKIREVGNYNNNINIGMNEFYININSEL